MNMAGRQKIQPVEFLRIGLYALVVILTLGVEDNYLTETLASPLLPGFYPLARDGFTVADMLGCVMLAVTVPVWLERRHRSDLAAFGLMGLAVLVSGFYGLAQGTSPGYTLFEPSIWKTLIPLFALTMAFSCTMREREQRERFLTWFCAAQCAAALYALFGYFVLKQGQYTYFDATVPVFAGDMLVFFIAAFAISFFRLVRKRTLRDIFFVGVLAIALLLSLRRSFITPILSVPLFLLGIGALRGRMRGKTALATLQIVLVMAVAAWAFLGEIASSMIGVDLLVGRLKSINLFWADSQTDTFLGTMGHTDDFLDAWDTVASSPIMGKGLAVWFPLERTSSWQEANVHAGLFKVWIKLGLLGVTGYLLIFGRGLRLWKDMKHLDEDSPIRMYAIWFSLHFVLTSVYMNSIFFGYKNSFVVAMYLSLCTVVLSQRDAGSMSATAQTQLPRLPVMEPATIAEGSKST